MPDQPADQKRSATLRVKVPTEGLPAPEAANWFRAARVGDVVQLSTGFIDFADLHLSVTALKNGTLPEDKTVNVDVTRRIVMQLSAVRMLQAALVEVMKDVQLDADEEDEE